MAQASRLCLTTAETALEWYHGDNIIGQPLTDPASGAVFDGITRDGPNKNAGAESVLSYLLAWLSLRSAAMPRPDREAAPYI